jgi:hypothetical protein
LVAAVGKQITAEEEEVVDEHLPSPCNGFWIFDSRRLGLNCEEIKYSHDQSLFEPEVFTEIEGIKI